MNSLTNKLNPELATMDAQERIAYGLSQLPAGFALTSSFGVQSAVCLHLATQVMPDIPVIVIDTGYLFPETYQFIDALSERLNLNLKVIQNPTSTAWFEARHGQLWNAGLEGIEQYNQLRKTAPLEQALTDLGIATWFSGIRRNQSDTRAKKDFVEFKNGRYKVHPILDWSDRDVFLYLKQHDLPYHPLWKKGYLSIGDTHSTQSIHQVDQVEQLRFFGLKRECGIHE
ncbi:phosphoadenylyl-sulfate reductase [Marinicella rhabdoformis]|uniref:phosphoadenylyl-sulfate reductase n=1 Tax=Marinicella rhabdoformis TaxID=2580566 RepID=UPI0012AECBB5|nr:phosphoadenylyl-sulfate reductase [Marinicella rhabdoformis]